MVIDESDRFNVLNCGRRWGKTDLLTDLALDGKHPDDPGSLLNGGRVGWWVGRQAQFQEVWDHVSNTLAPISAKQDASLHYIRLHTGGRLDFWTLYKDPNSGRGRKYHRSIVDEAAFATRLEKAWQRTIMPTLVDYGGDAYFASSPDGLNYFHHLHRMGDPTSPWYRAGWKSWTEPSWNNPYIDVDEIELMRGQMSDAAFRAEFGAEFLEGVGTWFSRDWLRWYRRPVPAESMVRVILVDPASGRTKQDGEDYTAIWVLGLHDDGNYYVLDFVRERYDLVERTRMLMGLHRLYKPLTVGYEQYGMQSDIQHIRDIQEQQQYRFDIVELGGKTPKAQRIQRLVAPFKTGRIWFPGAEVPGKLVQMAHQALRLWVELEYSIYPAGAENDDGLDALARIFDIGAEFPNRLAVHEPPVVIARPSIRSVLHGRY